MLSSLPFWLASVVLFILGASVGSFLNVMVYRSMRDQDWVSSRSKCDHCGQKLKWFDNLPLLSYLLLRGKSRCCRQSLGLTHPVVELLTGSLFVWWFWGGTLFFKLVQSPLSTLQPIFWLLVGVLLIGILIADWLYMIIPDLLVGALILMAFFYRAILVSLGAMQPLDLLYMFLSTLSLAAFFAGLWLVTKGRGLGFGDVKYAVAMGLILGWPRILVAVFLAFILGSLVSLFLIFLKKKQFGQRIAFGPFLVVGTVLALVMGSQLWEWYWRLML